MDRVFEDGALHQGAAPPNLPVNIFTPPLRRSKLFLLRKPQLMLQISAVV